MALQYDERNGFNVDGERTYEGGNFGVLLKRADKLAVTLKSVRQIGAVKSVLCYLGWPALLYE